MSRLAVSLGEDSQIAQIRFSTNLALSSSGATLSASNRRSRFWVLSPRWTFGSVLGGSAGLSGLSGSGLTSSADSGNAPASPQARTETATRIGNRALMPIRLSRHRGAIKTQVLQPPA